MKIFQKVNTFSIKSKRLSILGAFCVFCLAVGCTQVEPNNNIEKTSDKIAKSQFAQFNITPQIQSNSAPLLTLRELLSANDVKLALAKASAEGNVQLLEYWQNELVKAAEEVNLSETELELISGDQGLKYLEFQGMKTNYQTAFEQAFFEFQDVEAVYRAYPAFETLHERSRELVKQRDKLIELAAEELKTNGFEGDAINEARKQWQNYMLNKQ